MCKKSFLLIAVVFMFATAGYAQMGPKVDLTIGPQLGYQKAGDADNGKLMYGAAIRIHGVPFLGFEGSINYRQESYLNDRVTVKSFPIMVTGLLYVLPMVYGAVGFGWYNTKFDYNSELNTLGVSDKTTQKVGWHFGAGVQLPLGLKSDNYLIVDIRYVFLNYNFDGVPGSDVNANFYVITAGLQFGL